MDVLKKNILSIVAATIAIIAIVATFYPLSNWFDTRAADADARQHMYQKIVLLVNKHREWPQVSLGEKITAPLAQFPNTKIIGVAKDLKEYMEGQRRQMLELATRLNRHDLLTRFSLPAPRSASDALRFRQDLEVAIDDLKRNILRGGLPPTAENIQKRAQEIWRKKYLPNKETAGEHNEIWINEKEQRADFEAETAKLPEVMQREISTTCKMYLDDAAVSGSEDILKSNETPDAVTMWYAQMALWVQQDLAASIAQSNEASDSIETAAVKRVLTIDVSPDKTMYITPYTSSAGSYAPSSKGEAAAAASPSSALPELPGMSPTGRVSNALYDVVHWHILAHVDASKVDDFLKQLEGSRFVCIRQVDVVALDYPTVRQGGFSYGPTATVQVSVDGEELFLREWTVPLMPVDVRQMLGVDKAWTPSLGH